MFASDPQLLFPFFKQLIIAHFFRAAPSVFILRPGEHVFIGKQRQHVFWKMELTDLPEDDCFAALRKKVKEELGRKGVTVAPPCVSLAFDW